MSNDYFPLSQPFENYYIWSGVDIAPPAIALPHYTPDPVNNSTLYYIGTVVDEVTPIKTVEYRIRWVSDWTPVTPVDGAFDELTEDFEFTTPPLEDGTYVIEVRAKDSIVGHHDYAYTSDAITINTNTPPTLSILSPTSSSITVANTTLIASTNEHSTLKYDFVEVNYTQMNYTFSNTGITSHTTPLTNLPAGTNTVYVAASDISGNINSTTINVSWNVMPTLLRGDVSGDGKVDAWDITYLARAIAGIFGYEL